MSKHAARAAAGALILFAACSHQRMEQRNGCWIKKSESRLGDTREQITACQPTVPLWSADPLVRAIEDCLYQEQFGEYQENARAPAGQGRSMERCLEHAQKIALDRIDRLQADVAAAEQRTARIADENRELRQTLLTCVEKTPQAIAEAHATTDSQSGANTTHDERIERGRPIKRKAAADAPIATPTSATAPPTCPPATQVTGVPTPTLRR